MIPDNIVEAGFSSVRNSLFLIVTRTRIQSIFVHRNYSICGAHQKQGRVEISNRFVTLFLNHLFS